MEFWGNAEEADAKALFGGKAWDVGRDNPPTVDGSVEWVAPLKMIFSLEIVCFPEFWDVCFVRAIAMYCNASSFVLEIRNHDKIWGDNICTNVPTTNSGDSTPVIYARDN